MDVFLFREVDWTTTKLFTRERVCFFIFYGKNHPNRIHNMKVYWLHLHCCWHSVIVSLLKHWKYCTKCRSFCAQLAFLCIRNIAAAVWRVWPCCSHKEKTFLQKTLSTLAFILPLGIVLAHSFCYKLLRCGGWKRMNLNNSPFFVIVTLCIMKNSNHDQVSFSLPAPPPHNTTL